MIQVFLSIIMCAILWVVFFCVIVIDLSRIIRIDKCTCGPDDRCHICANGKKIKIVYEEELC